ncbi:MAG: DUF4389 domain-containing protein [Chloroflexi bacterium]|nr:DUF4389 domain-containing protein [Chloroflexota bacterium]
MATTQPAYPVQFEVDYPGEVDRLPNAFRIIWAIPIVIVVIVGFYGAGFVVFGPLLMILFRRKYPRWWFDWNLERMRFGARVASYLLLVAQRYPATDDAQAVHLDIPYPDAERALNRWLPLVKWLLAIPHYIALIVLWIALIITAVIAWVYVIVNGRVPRWYFDFAVGVLRWGNRVMAYAGLLATDRYPPFRLAA